ncbi:MAG: hypothetical protein ACR2JF_00700 [Iamia sp.]
MQPPRVAWPGGARFAFTVFDDTDGMDLVNGPPVYRLLSELGCRITKSVWPVAPSRPTVPGGLTCDDPGYLRWVRDLAEEGHEVGLHGATSEPSPRARTRRALDRFTELFGHHPRIGADHGGNREALYWGPARLSGARGRLYRRATQLTRPERVAFEGHLPRSPYFWGDLCRQRIDYWRNFSFTAANLLRPCPVLPYHDPARPYVNWWFASTHAPTLEPFLDLVRPERLDRLEEEGGVCIVYTHFGTDFAPAGRLDPRFVGALRDLTERDAWFAPASEVLDHLRSQQATSLLTDRDRGRLERRWIADHLRTRGGTELRRLRRPA